MRIAAPVITLALLLAGCGEDRPTRRPRGAAAYTGKRVVETENLGAAAGGTLVSSAGAERTLSSFHADGPALVIFYRGHW